MITLYLRAPDGVATCTSLPANHGRIEHDALTGQLVTVSSPSTLPILEIERAGPTSFIVRHVDDRLARKGRAKIHVGGRALALSESVLVREGLVIRVNAWTVRLGKARLPIAPGGSPSSLKIEERFLHSIREHPNDDEMREVYADWLEENGAHSAAEMLRLDVRLAKAKDPKERRVLSSALQAASSDVEDDWRVEVARPRIEACEHQDPKPLEWDFECPKEWQNLERLPHPKLRFCNACQKEVTYCTTIDEARSVAIRGGCVAVDPSLARAKGDLEARKQTFGHHRMGMLLVKV